MTSKLRCEEPDHAEIFSSVKEFGLNPMNHGEPLETIKQAW